IVRRSVPPAPTVSVRTGTLGGWRSRGEERSVSIRGIEETSPRRRKVAEPRALPAPARATTIRRMSTTLFMGLLCALTVGGLLLVFLVLRGRLDALAAELRAARRDVEGVGKRLEEIDARAAAALVEAASARERLAVDEGAEEVEGRA